MKFKLNQDHLDSLSNILDAGWYTLKVDSLTEKQDKDGADLDVFTLKVIASDDEENKKWIGRKAFFSISEKGPQFGVPFLRACGAPIPDKMGAEGLDINTKFCEGKVIKGQNQPGPDKNKVMRNNWVTFLPVKE